MRIVELYYLVDFTFKQINKYNPKYAFLYDDSKFSKLNYRIGKTKILNIGWFYKSPTKEFHPITESISFYASKADKCIVNGELVKKQEGEFYGGWITKNLTGPFKGAKGTSFW